MPLLDLCCRTQAIAALGAIQMRHVRFRMQAFHAIPRQRRERLGGACAPFSILGLAVSAHEALSRHQLLFFVLLEQAT